MATHDYVISNASGAAVRADLNNALAAIVSNNSNATEPSTTYSYMLWADTGSSPPVMKLRNAANDGWVTLFQLDGEWSSIAFEDGTAAAPSIYFKDSGTDTGFFSGGTDQVNVSTGGVERVEWGASEVVFNDGGENYDFRIEGDTNANLFFVDASADAVGIGTTTVSAKLHIAGATGGGVAGIWDTTAGGARVEYKDNGTRRGYLSWDTNSLLLAADSGNSIKFSTNAGVTQHATIDSSGRLLVGTSTSQGNNLLQIEGSSAGATGSGSILLRRGLAPASIVTGSTIGFIDYAANDGGVYARIEGVSDGTSASSDYPGRLVFSTTSDSASSPTERARINAEGYSLFSPNGSYYGIQAGASDFHSFDQTATGQWTLGIRNITANPNGVIISYSGTAPNGTSNQFFYCGDTTNLRMEVRSNGGIANYSGNNANLCDEREKKNIVNLDSTWNCLKHWELKKFHYNEDADTDDLRYGVIAQQVADYCPEVITEWIKQKAEPAKLGEDGTEIEPAKEEIVRMGVKEQQMMWMAIKALQEAQLRIETLEAEVAALKAS
jgi:hypothetical protein